MIANIYIQDEIGVQTTLKSVQDQYSTQRDAKEVMVYINSIGGDVVEGYAIHDFLRSLNKKITTNIIGKCYSIATVISLAGDKRMMSENSEFMIHNPWMDAGYGDATHYKKVSDQLEKEEGKLAKFYSTKTGVGITQLEALMDEETYLSLDEAKKLGFINAIENKLKAVAKIKEMKKENKTEAKTLLNKVRKALGLEGEPEAISAMVLEDGEYELADGLKFVIIDGVAQTVDVSEEANPAPEAPEDKLAALEARIAQIEAGASAKATEAKEAIQAKDEELEKAKASSEATINALKADFVKLNKLVADDEPAKVVKQNVSKESKEDTVASEQMKKYNEMKAKQNEGFKPTVTRRF